MSSITILDNEYLTIEYLADKNMVYQTIHKPISGPPFREGLAAVYDFFKQNNVSKYLSDDRLNGPLLAEDVAAGADWAKLIVTTNFRYWAIVVPQEIVSAYSMNVAITSLYDKGVHVAVFANTEEAASWLDERGSSNSGSVE